MSLFKRPKQSEYEQYLNRQRHQYGEKFDASELAPQFAPYLHTGQRIKVHMRWGEIKFGSVGVTTGWRPVFLLMHNSRCIGSSTTLNREDKIIAVRDENGRYPD